LSWCRALRGGVGELSVDHAPIAPAAPFCRLPAAPRWNLFLPLAFALFFGSLAGTTAAPAVRAVAERVTGSVAEDGVAVVLEELFPFWSTA
jgi:hypothetical protein